MADLAVFQVSTRVSFGPGAVQQVGELARSQGISKALVVTDPGVVAAGIAGQVVHGLAQAGVESLVFDSVEPNPSLETVDRAFKLYREAGCRGIVTVGGGSPMDAAKGVGLMASNPGELINYVGMGKVVRALPPLLAVPTTVGTGSEVTQFAVITNKAQRKKLVFGSPLLTPLFALLDPELVLGLPSGLAAATGMDALTHAVESVVSVFATPFSDALALEAIRLIGTNLPGAVASADLAPRANMLYASAMAGMAFNMARTGLVHGMSHPLSSYCGVPHGLANAILLPGVMAFNVPACEQALARVAQALGQAPQAQAAVEAMASLGAQVGIPPRLSQAGVTETFIPNMAQDAFESGNAQLVNPRKPSLAEILELYHQAL